MNKVLITGGAGFIGFHLAKDLIKSGFKVDIWDNFSRGVMDSELNALCAHTFCGYETVDLTVPIESTATDYDYIIHLAAIVGVKNVMNAPFDTLFNNGIILMHMIDFAKKQKQLNRFIFSSTSEVYADTLDRFGMLIPTPEETPLTIIDPANARTTYMLSKIYGEALLAHAGINHTIVRFHNVYGPRMGLSHVIPELLKKAYDAKERDSVPVYSPKHTRAFCYIDDAIRMLRRIMDNPCCNSKTYNIGVEDAEISIETLARTILKVMGKNNPLALKEETVGSPRRRAPAMGKLIRDIDVVPVTPLEKGIKKTYDWYSKHVFQSNGISAK